MRFELKNVKINKALSDESTCFSADLWADGKKVANCANRGQGGPDEICWIDQTKGKEIEALCARQPDDECDAYGMHLVMKYDVERLVGKLLGKYEEMKWLKAQCRKNILFRLKGDKADTWNVYQCRVLTPEFEKMIREKHGDQLERIANLETHEVVIELN